MQAFRYFDRTFRDADGEATARFDGYTTVDGSVGVDVGRSTVTLAVPNLLPRGLSRGALLVWHRDLGAAASPLLLLLLLTGGGLVFYSPPRAGSGVQSFRLRRSCELHPNGRSTVTLDAAGRVVGRVDACALPGGERAANALYPLHSGKTGGAAYRPVVLLGALALAALSAGGTVACLKRLTTPPSRPRSRGGGC